MSETLILLFINFSSFHGNGQAVWLGENGTVARQLAAHSSRPKMNCIFEYRVSAPRLKAIKAALSKLTITQARIKDRPGIPDEVRVEYGYRNAKGRFVVISLWENDLGKHQKVLGPLDMAIQEVFAEDMQKPQSCVEITRATRLRLHQPTWLVPRPAP